MLNFVEMPHVNGLDLAALGEMVEAIGQDPALAKTGFEVTTRWAGQTRSETVVEGFTLGGKRIERQHRIVADEPCELLGTDSAPNPQELLMAAFNACIMVGYVAGASTRGIRLDSIEIRTRGTLERQHRVRGIPGEQRACALCLEEPRDRARAEQSPKERRPQAKEIRPRPASRPRAHERLDEGSVVLRVRAEAAGRFLQSAL